MWLPPAAPVANAKLPSSRTAMIGEIEDRGRFPGLIKLFGVGGYPNPLVVLGVEKSRFVSLVSLSKHFAHLPSIWEFNTIPVSGTMTWLPKGRFVVVVREKTKPSLSDVTICEVPNLEQRLVLRSSCM
jgi:hypothetical protein